MEIGLALTGETAVSGGVVVTVGEPAFFVFIFPRGLDFARAIFVCVCVCVCCVLCGEDPCVAIYITASRWMVKHFELWRWRNGRRINGVQDL